MSIDLDGSQGVNRHHQFCYIQAKNDLEAISFFLTRFNAQAHTFRAYRKELERLLLWAITVAQKPLSSLLVDDCENYKRFLAAPDTAFCGLRAERFSTRWKPFATAPLSVKSQRQAIVIIRSAFEYLVGVRYLAGNPWVAVTNPIMVKEVNLLQLHKALPEVLWDKLVIVLTDLAQEPKSTQIRIALAAMLLMGDSGLRREETVQLRRHDISLSQFGEQLMECRVVGKGKKVREVPISQRTMIALRAHWKDHFTHRSEEETDFPVLAPLQLLPHPLVQQRHTKLGIMGYTANGLYRLLRTTLRTVLLEQAYLFTPEEIAQLDTTRAHAFRHTFGTLAAAANVPIDVTQSILGHASPATTAIYVRAKKKRIMEEASRFFNR